MQEIPATASERETLLLGDMSAPEQLLQSTFAEFFSSGITKKSAWASQIRDLRGLSAGDKLWLLSVTDKFHENKLEGVAYRIHSIHLDVGYGICAAIVPILIPFSQTFKDQEVKLMNVTMCIGTAISVLAVACSLVGTILHTIMVASKSKEQATLYGVEAENTDQELSMLFARAGIYAEHENDSERFKIFVSQYNKIRSGSSRLTLFTQGEPKGDVGIAS